MRIRKYIGAAVSLLLIGTILLVFADPWGSVRKDSRRILYLEELFRRRFVQKILTYM